MQSFIVFLFINSDNINDNYIIVLSIAPDFNYVNNRPGNVTESGLRLCDMTAQNIFYKRLFQSKIIWVVNRQNLRDVKKTQIKAKH